MGREWSGEDLLRAGLRHGVSQADAAKLFGVTVEEWIRWEDEGPPPDVAGLADWIRAGLV